MPHLKENFLPRFYTEHVFKIFGVMGIYSIKIFFLSTTSAIGRKAWRKVNVFLLYTSLAAF